jgi:hypothetical protein
MKQTVYLKVEIWSLVSMKDIYESKVRDLVRISTKRKANTDFDYKRIPLHDGTQRTRPPKTVEESAQYRRAADTLRKAGTRATPENVVLNLHGVSLRGGQRAAVRRTIHKAIAQNQGDWRPWKVKDIEIAKRLGITPDQMKAYKRSKFYPQSLPDTPEVREMITEEARKLGRHQVTSTMWKVLRAMDRM